MTDTYISCGLLIQSEIELPELLLVEDEIDADIRIQLADFEEDVFSNPTVTKPFSRMNPTEYYFEYPDVVRLLVRNGTDITIDLLSDDSRFARQFIYDNALPMAMMQRKMVLFRASGVVDHHHKVWLFFATPRSGKTATALKLVERGYRFFSDTIIGLTINPDGSILATPFGPAVYLWPPVELIQEVFPDYKLHPVREGIHKKVGILDGKLWSPEPKIVAGLMEVEQVANSMGHHPITMVEAFEVLRNGVYFNHNTVHMDMEPQIFGMLSSLVKQTKLMRITRPKMSESYSEMAEYIDALIHSGGANA
jgi:hypothetical protein